MRPCDHLSGRERTTQSDPRPAAAPCPAPYQRDVPRARSIGRVGSPCFGGRPADGGTAYAATSREVVMSSSSETGQVTGTKDKDYNIIWFTEVCLSNVLRLETYIKDAEREGDSELAEFFRRAQGESRKGAEQGKQLLAARLGR